MRDRAWSEMVRSGLIERLARFAYRRACAQHGWFFPAGHAIVREYIDEAPERILSRRENFLTGFQAAQTEGRLEGFFEGWSGPVLVSGFCQKVRDWVATRRADSVVRPAPAAVDPAAESLRQALASDEPLSEADLDRIARWDLDQRLFLAAEAGFHHKVPLYQAWAEQRGLTTPFPPAEYLRAPSHRRRNILADAMGVTRDLADQWWKRGKDLLRSLDLFRGV